MSMLLALYLTVLLTLSRLEEKFIRDNNDDFDLFS